MNMRSEVHGIFHARVAQERRRVLFVDDDEDFLDDVRLVLANEPFAIATETTFAGAVAHASVPEATFVDLGLPDGDGVELVRRLTARWPAVPVVVLTVQHDEARILAAFRAGARGYIFKDDVPVRLRPALEDALAGGAPMSAAVARRVLRLVAALPEGPRLEHEPLTAQELTIVRELASGATYEQSAHAVGISVNTLRTHVRNIYRKLSVGSRTEAVMSALRLGLLERR
jgi:DNA-binding NarL/FixJ family response regulator